MQYFDHKLVANSLTRGLGNARSRALAFARQETGNLTVFALSLFMAMVMIGGLAVDIMRYETIRTKLQNTLDRSTLAAASLTQELDARSVVNDYFTKAGLIQYLKTVNVSEGLNFREVSADATAGTDPIFLHLMGINKMDATGHSKAEQRVTNVEIMLVLDISGSMASNSKLTNLKSAANEFVNTVLSSDAEGRISIGLVPFNGQVNLGATLAAKYTLTDPPGVANAYCVDLPAAAYSSLTLSRTTSMSMTANADSYSTTNQTTSYVAPTDTSYGTANSANLWCPPSTTNIVRLPSKSITGLQSAINGLSAIGATSINAGMRWGTALLDPGSRTMFDQFITAGAMPSSFSGRPYDYTDDDAMKIIVLMTDGEHFAEERINTGPSTNYKTGNSPIYKAPNGNYSIRFTSGRPTAAGTKEYWVPHLCTSSNCKAGTNTAEAWSATAYTNNSTAATVQTWPQVWASMRTSYVAWQFYARALGNNTTRATVYTNMMEAMRSQTATTSMDNQLQSMCTAAKNKAVTIYGIAFEAPSNGQTQIASCASSPAHYFNATGLQIKTAFRAIASNISQLRLTQ